MLLPNGSIRTRVRTRTHREDSQRDKSQLFWNKDMAATDPSCCTERRRLVRLPNGSIRTRTRTKTHRLQDNENNDSSQKAFWNRVCHAVKFGQIQVREYERVIDSTALYLGLALGWNWFHETVRPLITTEPLQQQETTSNNNTKSSKSQSNNDEPTRMQRTNGNERFRLWQRYGYSPKELKQATKEAHTLFKQRERALVADEH